MSSDTNDRLKLSEDLLNEIFLRSFVKSLLRAKCACKQWYALIQNPSFTFNHLQYQKSHNKGRLLLQYYEELDTEQQRYALFDDETLERDTYQDIDYLQECCLLIEGPIEGLYCLFDGEDRIVLWNPTLMEIKTLPLPHPHFFPDRTVYTGSIGFGIVYNLTTNAWRLLKHCNFEVVDYLAHRRRTSSFIDGSCHWWTTRGVVIAFDMAEETFRLITGPDLSDLESSSGSLTIYNDKVALMYRYENSVEIWVMLEEGVWIKQFSVTSLPRLSWAVGLWKNIGIFLTMDGFETNKTSKNFQMVLYNSNTQKMRVMGPKGDPKSFHAYVYYESLVSLGTEHKGKRTSLNTVSDFLLGSENIPNWWRR